MVLFENVRLRTPEIMSAVSVVVNLQLVMVTSRLSPSTTIQSSPVWISQSEIRILVQFQRFMPSVLGPSSS